MSTKTINRFLNADGSRVRTEIPKGTKFRVAKIIEWNTGSEVVRVGDELTLTDDDNTSSPQFRIDRLAGSKKRALYFVSLEMLEEVEAPAAKQFRVKHCRGWAEVPVKKGDVVTLIEDKGDGIVLVSVPNGSTNGCGESGWNIDMSCLEEVVQAPAVVEAPKPTLRIKVGDFVMTLTDASEVGGITLGKPYKVTSADPDIIQFRDDQGSYRLRKSEFYEVVDPAHFDGWTVGGKVRFTKSFDHGRARVELGGAGVTFKRGSEEVVRYTDGFTGTPTNGWCPGWFTVGYEKLGALAPETEATIKVGDRVREKATGKVGEVVKDDKSDFLPLRVKFDTDAGEHEDYEWCDADELTMFVEQPTMLIASSYSETGLEPDLALEPDAIFAPSHYARFAIQPKDFITQNRLTYNVGTVVSYLCRFDAKNGLEDLLKAREHLDYLIEAERGLPGSQKAMAA